MSDKTVDDDTLRRLLAGLRHGPVHITGGRCDGDSRAVEAFCGIIRVAPALAAEVLRLRAEIERRDADHAEMECSEIERHQRMCAALDIPEEDRAYATDAEVEAAATDAVCERDALAAEVLRLRAERDALRGIVVRLAGDDGMYSDDYGMRCLCGFKRDHDDGCLRAEAQALIGGGQ